MNRLLKTTLIGASVASLAVVSAFAQERAERSSNDRARAGRSEAAPEAVVADAPGVRLAGLIRFDNLVPQRNKNIANVRRIAAGVYCIRPTAASGINPATAVVTLTVEYFFSVYNESTVQWASRQSGCNANEIGVYTFADVNLDARYTFSNLVSFSIIVP
jgi:hypothetical protein